MRALRVAVGVVTAAVFALALTCVAYGLRGLLPSGVIRGLGTFFLRESFNVFNKAWWVGSPEVVNAILWDYRGLDTVFETSVLFLAIAGCEAVFRLLKPSLKELRPVVGGYELTVVVKTVVKLLAIAIVLISLGTALRGYVTPGGGFQGGAAFAIAPLLIIAAFSRHYLRELGFKIPKLSAVRGAGLLAIALVALAPLAFLGFALQNQAKPPSPFPGFPVFVGPIFTAGTLLAFNVGELLVVSMEFTIAFILVSVAEEVFRRDRGAGQ